MHDPTRRFRTWLSFEVELLRHDGREWLLLTGDRLLVALLALLGLGAVFAATVRWGLVPLRDETPVLFLLFALIGANFTLVAIVTSLSQLVLSRRLESPGDVRRKLTETQSYRDDVAETVRQDVLPVRPDAFFLLLYQNAREDLETLAGLQTEARTRRARDQLDALTAGLTEHIDYVIDVLEDPTSGMKHALFTSLTADYEEHVHRTWFLQSEHAEQFTEQASQPLAHLVETLHHIEVASRMFKTVFIESEVSELSRVLLYVALPVQIVAVVTMALYSASGSTPTVSHATVRVLVPAVFAGGFAPFLILASYVVRLTVVARRTADSFPFSSQLRGTLGMRSEEWERN